MGSERLASYDQRARIVELYAKSDIPFDAAQAFIDACEGRLSAQERQEATDLDFAYWEELFPRKGAAIMGFVHPFYYEWKPKLNSALPDLEDRAKEVVFWRKVAGVKVYRLSEAASLGASLEDSLKVTLGDSIWRSLRASLWHSFRASPWDSRRASHWDLLRASLRRSLRALLGASLKDSLGDSLAASFKDSLKDSLLKSLFYSLIYPLAYVLADEPDEVRKFRALHQLWLAGNYPVGFDREWNLLVLVA